MNNLISYECTISRLEENGLQYHVLELQNGVRIIITQRGGRILGPFLSEEGSSILWMNSAFSNQKAFKKFLESEDWNLGGDRIWIAPEIQYHCKERNKFWDTLSVPAGVDPGDYRLTEEGGYMYVLSQEMSIEAYNLLHGTKELLLKRIVQKADNPLRSLSRFEELMQGVVFAGYEQTILLKEEKAGGIMAETWNLTQLNPGGNLLILSTSSLEYVDYYEPVNRDYQIIHPGYVQLRITGDRQYKTGYKSANVLGRLAYYNSLDEQNSYLLIRNFFNNPSSVYSEEPASKMGNNGYSIHVYNDGGDLGGFGELESNGQTIGGSTGKAESTDQMVTWLFSGGKDALKQIALNLLGVEII